MTDLQPLYKVFRNYFNETSVKEWSYLYFLKSIEPVIMANIDITKNADKDTWRKRFVKCLEKIIDDDVYNEYHKNVVRHLKEKVFYFLNINSIA